MAQTNTASAREVLKQLEDQAPVLQVDNQIKLDLYLRSATKLNTEAKTQFLKSEKVIYYDSLLILFQYHDLHDQEASYVLLLRFVHLLLYTIPKHSDFKHANDTQRSTLDDLKGIYPCPFGTHPRKQREVKRWMTYPYYVETLKATTKLLH